MDQSEDKAVRLHVVISKRELRAIDAWRREQDELPNRSQAVRKLLELALQINPEEAV